MLKVIKEFPRYAASPNGDVVNLKTGRVLKPQTLTKGYKGYRLYLDNKRAKTVKAHRIIALCFIDNPLNLPQVNHKDGNKSNNHMDNLEWCSNEYNHAHAIETGLWVPPPIKYEDKIPEMIKLKESGLSTRAISKLIGVSKSTVSKYLICTTIEQTIRS